MTWANRTVRAVRAVRAVPAIRAARAVHVGPVVPAVRPFHSPCVPRSGGPRPGRRQAAATVVRGGAEDDRGRGAGVEHDGRRIRLPRAGGRQLRAVQVRERAARRLPTAAERAGRAAG